MSELQAARATDKSGPNLGDLVEDALHQVKSLVQAELSLARRELTSEVVSAVGAAGLIIVGVMVAQATLTTLGVLLVLAFNSVLAAAGVVVVLALVSVGLILLGVQTLKRRKMPRTADRLARDARQVLETVK